MRLFSGPLIAQWIIDCNWNLVIPAVAIAGISDWLDGQIARKRGSNSVLGSYLDPLADKVLIGSIVGALGYSGALPLPLVGVIVGRDVLLVGGAFILRAESLGWQWPGAREFFRVVPVSSPRNGPNQPSNIGKHVPAAPIVKPLIISKVNTGFQLALVAATVLNASMAWPTEEIIWMLGASTAGTTLWSTVAYLRIFNTNRISVDTTSGKKDGL